MDRMSTDGVMFLCLQAQASHYILAQNVNGSSGIAPVLSHTGVVFIMKNLISILIL